MMQEYTHGGDDREVVAQAEVVFKSGAFGSGQIVDDAGRAAGRMLRKYQRAS